MFCTTHVYVCLCVCIIPGQDDDQFIIQMLNGIGDYSDLRKALNLYSRPNFHRMTLEEIKQHMERSGHCSALVKVYYDCMVSAQLSSRLVCL